MSVTTAVTYFVYPTAGALARAMAEQILDAAQIAVAARGIARIAISGGNTPRRTFELLADPGEPFASAIPWDKLDLFWVDERCVPPDDKDSNYRMTREALLDNVPLRLDQIHRMEGELDPQLESMIISCRIQLYWHIENVDT